MNKITILILGLNLLVTGAGVAQPVCLPKVCPPKVEWERSYGGTDGDTAWVIIQCPDGGYLVAGASGSSLSGNKTSPHFGEGDYWALRLEANGNIRWDASYGGTAAEGIRCATLTADGGFILGGISSSGISGNKTAPNLGATDWWVVRCNGNGVKLWDRTYGTTGFDTLTSVLELPDGKLLMCGTRAEVKRTDSNGNLEWETSYAPPTGSTAFSKVQRASDGGFLLSGASTSAPGGPKQSLNYGGADFWYLRTGPFPTPNSDPIRIWDRSWGGTLRESPNANSTMTRLTPDDGFISCGYSVSGIGGNKESAPWGGEDAVAVRYDASGNKLWDRSFGGVHNDEFWSVAPAHDGNGYVFSGYSYSGKSGNKESPLRAGAPGDPKDGWVVRVCANGNKLWDESYGGSDHDTLIVVQPTSDGGYILAGSSASPRFSGNKMAMNYGGDDAWIIKLYPEVDNDPPVLLSVEANCLRGFITVNFDEVLDPVSAQNLAHYTIDGLPLNLTGNEAKLSQDRKSVVLKLVVNSPSGGGTHLLTINGVADACGHVLNNTPVPFAFNCLGVIRGTVFHDVKPNCTQNLPGDYGLPNWQVTVMDGGNIYHTFTDLNGDYELALLPGNYTVSAPDLPPDWVTPSGFPHCIHTSEPFAVAWGAVMGPTNFPKRPLNKCPDLWVTVTPDYSGLAFSNRGPASPCCGQNMKLIIDYGNRSAAGAAVPNKSSDPITDRAKLELSLPGYGIDFSQFSASVSAVEEFSSVPPKACWTLPFMPPGFKGTIVVTLHVSDCDPANTEPEDLPSVQAIPRISSKYPECPDALWDNETNFTVRADCSGDPNGKQVSPRGCGPQGYVPLGQELTYFIEFQNTGTGPAYHVVLHDLLSTNLDLATVTVTKSSHPHVLTTNGRELRFTFWGIYLPAARVDEPASHGYVEFRVRPRADAPAGTVITNRADIYFDLNEPVLTGTTTNTLTDAPLPRAAFTLAPRPGSAGHTNDFTYTGGTVGATFRWEFGPGAVPATSTDAHPAGVVFPTNGVKLVTLEVALGDCVSAPATRVFTVGQPTLRIQRNDSEAFLLWEGEGYVVEEADELTPPAGWRLSSGTAGAFGGTHVLTLPLAPAGNRFFRLREP